MTKRNKILGGAAALLAMVIAAVLMLTRPEQAPTPTAFGLASVPAGGDVQAVINAANCGDVITLEAGATYPKPITLPVKPCTDTSYITIQSSRASELPEGKRVGPAQASLLAWLQSGVNAEPVIKTAPGAHHYKINGIRASTANEGVFVYDIVRLGGGRDTQKTVAEAPHHIVIDRSYIHGWGSQNVLRGVAANCGECSVINSYIDEIHWEGIEAQAIDAWNGPGPFHFVNNFLAGAGQSIMIGGADSAIPELMPASGEILRNHMFKPLSWKVGDPSYAGKHWTVKNGLEFKVGKNWVVDGNVIENVWVDAQDGSIVLFTVRNQECSAKWSTIQHITFTNNIVKGAAGAALNFLGIDNEATLEYVTKNPGKCPGFDPAKLGSVRGADVTVRNNVFVDIAGAFLQINGFPDVKLERNTHLQSCTEGCNTMTLYGEPSPRLIYRDNVTQERPYGIFGENVAGGKAAFDKFAPEGIFTGNVVATPYDNLKIAGNEYVAALTISSDFRTPYVGKGANIDQLLAAQAGVVSPVPSPTASVQPSASPSVSPSIQPSPSASPTATAPLPSPTQPPPSPSPTVAPTPRPSPSPTPAPCPATAWPSSVSGRNSKMAERRAQGCYPVRQPNLGTMEYARP